MRVFLTEEHKRRIGLSLMGHLVSKGTRNKLKGHIVSDKTRKKIGLANSKKWIDKTCLSCSKHFSVTPARKDTSSFCSIKCLAFSRVGKRGPRFGVKYSEELRRKLSESHKGKNKGKNNPSWRGGVSFHRNAERLKAWKSLEYRLWREAVFKRDNYTCIWCGARNGNGYTVKLEADHIKRWVDCPELRLAIDNGRTLCRPCHIKTFKIKDLVV